MAKQRFSNTVDIPFDKIKVAPKTFQGRQSDFSTDTTNAIVRKGFYDRSGEPIVVFPENGFFVVISGHSRWEAIKQIYKSGKQPNLKTVPAKKFLGSKEEAIDYAVIESNRGSTQEGLKSDLQAYKRAIERGQNKEQLLAVFKPTSRLEKLRRLAYLNTNGQFLQYMDSADERSFPYLERNAIWVGELRRNLPQLTNAHENELFNYLYKGATKQLTIKKDVFFNMVDKRVNRIDFNKNNALNLENKVSSSAYTDPIVEQIKEIEKQKNDLKKKIDAKTTSIARAKDLGKNELVPSLQKEINDMQQVMIRLEQQRLTLEQTKGRIERETTVDLFADPEPTPIRQKKKTSTRRKLSAPGKTKTAKRPVKAPVKKTSSRRKLAKPAAKPKPTPKPKPMAKSKPKPILARKKTTPLQRLKRAVRAIERPTGVKLDGTLKKGYTRLKNGDIVRSTLLKYCAPTRATNKRK